MRPGRHRLPPRPDLLPQLQVPVRVPRRAGRLRAALQPGRDAAGPRLPHAAPGAGARGVLREVGVRTAGGGQRPGGLRHGW